MSTTTTTTTSVLTIDCKNIHDIGKLCFDGVNQINCFGISDDSICLLFHHHEKALLCSKSVVITELNLCDCQLGKEGCKSISEFLKATASLMTLGFGSNKIVNDEGIEIMMDGLVRNNTVTSLNFGGQTHLKRLSEQCVLLKSITSALSSTSNRVSTTVRISRDGLWGGGMRREFCSKRRRLDPLLQKIECIALNSADNIEGTRLIVACIKKTLCNLASLHLSRCQMSHDDWKSIAELLSRTTSLNQFSLSMNEMDDKVVRMIMDGFAYNKSITEFNSFGNRFSRKGSTAMSEMLTTNSTLTSLILDCNTFEDEGIEIIVDSLVHNQSITKLSLSTNTFGPNNDTKGWKSVSKLLTTNKNTTLTNLCVEAKKSTPGYFVGTELLMKGLAHNKTITKFMLREANLGEKQYKSISEMLTMNSTLTELDLEDNSIDDTGIGIIMEGLAYNKSTTTLHLSNNVFTNEGCQCLSKMLTKNTMLQSLFLEENQFDDVGIGMIMEGLNADNNKTLTQLNLRHNLIKKEGCESIWKALQSNIYLKHVHFGCEDKCHNHGKRWWMGTTSHEEIIPKILFQLGLNQTGLQQKLIQEKDKNNAVISREEWVDTLVKAGHVDLYITEWRYENGFYDEDEDEDDEDNDGAFCFHAGLNLSYICLRNMVDKIFV